MPRAHPQLITGKLEKLHPTQLTVGLAEVNTKREQWKKLKRKERSAALDNHWFPCVLGPQGRHYIVDHHHFGLALIQEEVTTVPLLVLKDLSFVEPMTFWNVMSFNQWVHPYDAHGAQHSFEAIPKSIVDLQDDPYRSLAGQVRRAGGYSKDTTPYSEFLWADFFRSRISSDQIKDLGSKLQTKAMDLARSQEARYLPGWAGPIVD
ncbi:ParB-like protein [Pseudomonas sp. 6D_7.1_Bac1]|uniref:ParB-like protein n=1 Tax=Pseudomonas sp. 6D_7.1_Bac1 TaxID=2971615 RepID=UPI0021C58A26|nr:ParB-like protein [Pseudomonas sp. 6D_7.1_Bac1]MCU1749099.1 chromosome partitioning protein ParB [Pseudomonas sp. 6D_7.1_Bac1]